MKFKKKFWKNIVTKNFFKIKKIFRLLVDISKNMRQYIRVYFKLIFAITRKSDLYTYISGFRRGGEGGGNIAFFVCVDDGASFHLKPLNLKHKGSLKCAEELISLGLFTKILKQQTISGWLIWIEILCF